MIFFFGIFYFLYEFRENLKFLNFSLVLLMENCYDLGFFVLYLEWVCL